MKKGTTDIDRFELFRVLSTEHEAYIIKGMLETNGIKCFIDGEALSSVYPSALTFSPLRLFIRKADFLMAEELLDELK